VGGPAGRAGPLVFVADVDRPELADDDRHHLARVLRLRPGDPLTVADGAGRWRPCRFGPEPEPDGEVAVEPVRSPAITVAFAPVKGDRPEWVVQKLTELGVDRVVPLAAARSVVRWDGERGERQVGRLRRVAREAAMQAHRARLPEIAAVAGFGELAAVGGATLADLGGGPPSLDRPFVLVGPEGGWSDEERSAGLATVGLADHVLRAETAAVVAGAVLAALRAGRVAPVPDPDRG
jgi:16S rRNA (uracil1498-N3)-methyltransferase